LQIVPHGVAQVLLLQFDRIMIRNMINSAAAGIYSLAGNIRLILTIIIDSIANTWQTWFYEEIEKKNTSEIQLRAKQMIGVFAVMCIGLMALSPELVLILGGLEYIDARFVTVPMIMDAFIIFIYNVIIPAEYYKKKTNFVMIGTIFATALNIAGNYIFISRYGFIAAAYTTLFSYVCYLIFHLIISHKVVKFDIVEMPYLFVMTTSVSVIAFVNIFYIDSLIIRWIFTLCMIAAFVFVLNRKYRIVNDTLKLLQKKAHKS
jgi:O-antigen/teichoic acid export membrane protein